MADDVDTLHPDYAPAADNWITCRDVFGGSKRVKAAGDRYLPRLSGQTESEYQAYKTRARFYNAFKRTVQGLTGVAFMKTPAITLPDTMTRSEGTPTKTPVLQDHLTDITMASDPFSNFAMKCAVELLTVGRTGVLIDFANRDGRPYWRNYVAEDIRNWDTVVQDGDTTLTLLVLRETKEVRTGFVIEREDQYRVCQLLRPEGAALGVYTVTVYSRGPEGTWLSGQPMVPTRKGQPLDFIPFVCVGPNGVTMDMADPPLLDLVDINLSHYRGSADLKHGLHYTGLPTPIITGSEFEGPLKLGSSEATVLPELGANVKYLEFTGTGLGPLKEDLLDEERMMAILGARLLEGQKTAAESAAAIRLRQAGDNATLSTIMGSISQGLTMLLRWHAYWFGATDQYDDMAVSVMLHSDFTDEGALDLNALSLLAQADKISFATLYFNLERVGLTRPGVTFEAEREQILLEGGADPMRGPAQADPELEPA